MVRRRPSMGWQQIQIRRVESEEERQGCFSKCHARLFKKANELAILHGVEMAAVIFAPDGKALSFGKPSFEAIRERFAPTGAAAGGAGGAGAREDNNQLADLNLQYRELKALLCVKNVRKERVEAAMAKERAAASRGPTAMGVEADVRNMGEEELMDFNAPMQEMRAAVAAGRNSTNNNGAEIDTQMQPMMAMTPPPGFDVTNMEMMPQQVFGGFPGPN